MNAFEKSVNTCQGDVHLRNPIFTNKLWLVKIQCFLSSHPIYFF